MEFEINTFTTPWGAEIKACTRNGTNDWNTLYSCLVQDEYKLAHLNQSNPSKKIAVDIGGHIGGCTLALLSLRYTVYTVEPMPENIEMIKKNVELNNFQNRSHLFGKAISSKSNEKLILKYGSSLTESGRHHKYIGNTIVLDETNKDNIWNDGDEILVETVSVDDVMKDISYVDFLKIDCEGAEWSAFSGTSKETFAKIQRIAAEVHPTDGREDLYKKMNYLIGKDFKDFSSEYFGVIENKNSINLAYFQK
ncbi:FkbM family methyltransferase [bacterium]|nr:FkbM family methyltransferase [bacterium]